MLGRTFGDIILTCVGTWTRIADDTRNVEEKQSSKKKKSSYSYGNLKTF